MDIQISSITKEKYISFTKHVDNIKDKNENNFYKNCIKLRFIDSFKFLSTTSLDKLVSYLDKKKLKITQSEFCHLRMVLNFSYAKTSFLYRYFAIWFDPQRTSGIIE